MWARAAASRGTAPRRASASSGWPRLPRRVPPPRTPPLLVGAVTGLVAAYLVAGHVVRAGGISVDALVLVLAHGGLFGLAGASLVVGRRAGSPWVVGVALAALAADPVRLLVPALAVPRLGTWLTVGSVSLSGLTVGLAGVAAVGAWLRA
jgi:hypothetical protein